MNSHASHSVGIVGLGLIGGSLAVALKECGFASRLIAFDSDAEVARRGIDFGVVDDAVDTLEELVAGADIVVIATPTQAAVGMLEQLFRILAAGGGECWITDVASVKGPLCRAVEGAGADLRRLFIPGHPIAGSEKSGVGAAKADLFEHHRVVLTPTAYSDPAGVRQVRAMWEAAGALVVQLDIDEHDRVLAASSHLPHALAFTLVDALAKSDESSEVFRLAAGGFRDFTRIASSDPVMWRDISLANADQLLAAIDLFSEHLAGLRQLIASRDASGLEHMFAEAKRARDEFAADLMARQRRKPPQRD